MPKETLPIVVLWNIPDAIQDKTLDETLGLGELSMFIPLSTATINMADPQNFRDYLHQWHDLFPFHISLDSCSKNWDLF